MPGVPQLGSTMIYVTHDQVEAMTMGDRICVLPDGLIQKRRPACLFIDWTDAFSNRFWDNESSIPRYAGVRGRGNRRGVEVRTS
jgi:multiple sugar transport system ATP-binding protein